MDSTVNDNTVENASIVAVKEENLYDESPIYDSFNLNDILSFTTFTDEDVEDIKIKCEPIITKEIDVKDEISNTSSTGQSYTTHTREKPFRCTLCDNKFSRKQTLLVYILTYTGEKPFKCEDANSVIFEIEDVLEDFPDVISVIDSDYEDDQKCATSPSEEVILPSPALQLEKDHKDSFKSIKQKKLPNFCYYCKRDVLNFARHIKRSHNSEVESQKIFALPTSSKERKDLFTFLRNKGNYLKNSSQCFKPVKRTFTTDYNNYVPCKHCLGYYRPKRLWRHVKHCKLNNGSCKSFSHLTDSQNLLLSHLKINSELKEKVFPRMLADKVSLVAKQDFLICTFGAWYIKNYRQKQYIQVCSRKMRELSRLLIEVMKSNATLKNLISLLNPQYFDLVVKCTKQIAQYDENNRVYMSPTYTNNIYTHLKQCCDLAMKKEYIYASKTNLETFKRLLQTKWRLQISTNLIKEKCNKVTMVSLATDLKLLVDYLTHTANKSFKDLQKNQTNKRAYQLLIETVFCRLLLLNRTREEELQRMSLDTYRNSTEEFERNATLAEQILLQKYKRVTIIRRGKEVYVLFSLKLQADIQLLLDLRSNFVSKNNIYLFANINTRTPLIGYKILEKYAKKCGVSNVDAITSTRLKKQVLTIAQVLEMSPNNILQLTTRMGVIHTNADKLSKLAMLMEKGRVGKLLDEIDGKIEKELNGIKNNYRSSIVLPLCNIVKKPRVLIPWTIQQKELIKIFFQDNIINKVPPKQRECETLKSQTGNVFDNKTWQQMKVYIQNCYSK